MIDTDETGQRKWTDITRAVNSGPWNEWEQGFIYSMLRTPYRNLSDKQKALVGRLFDKLNGR